MVSHPGGILCWESSGVVRFDLGAPLHGQMKIAKLKSAYFVAFVRYSPEICELSGVINHKTEDFLL